MDTCTDFADINPKVEVGQDGKFIVTVPSKKFGLDNGLFVAVRCIQKIKKKSDKPIFVGVAGPSGSGKTTLTNGIKNIIPSAIVISLDNYLDTSKQVIDYNFDDPRLMDFDLLLKNISELKEGKSTEVPLYDFRKSGRYAYQTIFPPSGSKVIIVEGTHALHEAVIHMYDLKIAVSGGVHFDLVKRVMRDRQRTGQNPNESIIQISETVYPMYRIFIEPSLKKADIRIVNSYNPLAGLQSPNYEIKKQILASQAAEYETKIVEALTKFSGQQFSAEPEIHDYNDVFMLPPNSDAEEEDANKKIPYIRIRNSEGKYSLMFSEVYTEDNIVISPNLEFDISIRTFSGLLSLGYKIESVLNRTCKVFKVLANSGNMNENFTLKVSIDTVKELNDTAFVHIRAKDKMELLNFGNLLGIAKNEMIAKTYIQIYKEFQAANEKNKK